MTAHSIDFCGLGMRLARKHNVAVDYSMIGVCDLTDGSYHTRLLSLPTRRAVHSNGSANLLLRRIRVPRFGLGLSDDECLAVWLHELGHVCSVWRELWLQLATWFPTSRRVRVWCERDAWRWARKQIVFTDRMHLQAHNSLVTYEAVLTRDNFLKWVDTPSGPVLELLA